MSKSQRDKGKRGENEVAHLWRKAGFIADRTRQSDGEHDPDVRVSNGETGKHESVFVEVKRYARVSALNWLRKAQEDAKVRHSDDLPVVFIRRDGDQKWSVLMDSEDFFRIYTRE